MSDSMETGGIGKNPAIDKINQLNAQDNRMNVVSALESKMFSAMQPRAQAVLRKRSLIMENFHIGFPKKEMREDGHILHERKPGVHAGERAYDDVETARAGYADNFSGGVLSHGRGQERQDLSMGRAAERNMGEQLWRADDRSDD